MRVLTSRRRKITNWTLGLGLAALLAGGSTTVRAFETAAKHAYIIDLSTNTVLLEKDALAPMAPASMSKLMTVYMVFERLKDGRLSLDDKLRVSENAWRKGGSKMFVKEGSTVALGDLLRGVIVQSGNDACIVLAEAISGSEEAFAEEMNKKAREIGLEHSHFANATGWPDPKHVMSARDIAHLSRQIVERFPEYYKYFHEQTFTYNGIKQGNRNPLLYKDLGADGLKTGHTEDSGYGLVASAEQEGRRIVMVVNGLDSVRDRSSESERLLNWAFRSFKSYSLFEKGQEVDKAAVWLGVEPTIPLVVDEPVKVTVNRKARSELKATIKYTAPLPAPIKAGTPVAQLIVTAPGLETKTVPLLAGADVERLGVFGRLGAAVRYLVLGPQG